MLTKITDLDYAVRSRVRYDLLNGQWSLLDQGDQRQFDEQTMICFEENFISYSSWTKSDFSQNLKQ